MSSLTYESVLSLLETNFVLQSADLEDSMKLKLTTVDQKEVNDTTEHYSLLFEGPIQPLLPQKNYDFYHEQLGKFPLFIVPIGRGETGVVIYEAVIFRKLKN
ncbi:MAG: hypothetical protein H0Z32_13030 [Bacillaceae bacterium]|nr:hypothetical protein [Bacillaceae bacterium]